MSVSQIVGQAEEAQFVGRRDLPTLTQWIIFCGAVVYGRTLPENEADIMDRIHQATATVTEEMLVRTWQNLLKRNCIEVGGGHFEHLL